MPEPIVAVVHGKSLRGNGIVVTPSRVIGKQRTRLGELYNDYTAYMGRMSTLGQKDRQEAYRWAYDVVNERQYELPWSDIQAVFYREPGTVKMGQVTLRTPRGDVNIELANYMAGANESASLILMASLAEFIPDRIFGPNGEPLSVAVTLGGKRGRDLSIAIAPRPSGAGSQGPQPAAATPPTPGSEPTCPRCGKPVTWVPQYQRWYCSAENVYPWG